MINENTLKVLDKINEKLESSSFSYLENIVLILDLPMYFSRSLDELLDGFSPEEIVRKSVFGNVDFFADLFSFDAYENIASYSFESARKELLDNFYDDFVEFLKNNPSYLED